MTKLPASQGQRRCPSASRESGPNNKNLEVLLKLAILSRWGSLFMSVSGRRRYNQFKNTRPLKFIRDLIRGRLKYRGRQIGIYSALLTATLAFVMSVIASSRSTLKIRADQDRMLSLISMQMAERLASNLYDRFSDLQSLSVLDVIRDPHASSHKKRLVLDQLKSSYPSYAWVGITDTKGKVLASSGGVLEGVDVSQRLWFQEGQKGPWVGDVHEAKLLAKVLLADRDGAPLRFADVTTKLTNEKGLFTGVIGAHLSWTWSREASQSLLANTKPEDKISIFVFRSNGEVILSTSREPVTNTKALFETAQRWLQQKEPQSNGQLGTEAHGYLLGVSQLKPHIQAPSPGWVVVAAQPAETAFAPARDLRREILWSGLLVGISFALLSFLMSENFEEAIVSARLKAEATAAAKSQFLAEMSHEIRTPINGVVGMARLLLDTKLDLVQRDYASRVLQSGEGLLRIINDILDVSKVEAGKMQLESTEFFLEEIVNVSLAPLRLACASKSIGLSCEFIGFDRQTLLIGDPGRITQILLNLVSNAVKFTSQGSVRVLVRNEGERDGKVALKFEVIDTGIGIDPAKVGDLFQDFQQASPSTNRKFGGTGLGLSISKRLVNLMGGDIGAHSEPGKGSCFWFKIALPLGEIANLHTAESPKSKASRAAQILVVDDNPTNLLIAVRSLEKAGYDVQGVKSAAEAFEKLAMQSFDLILMDCQMPEMDGYEATQEIRANSALNHQQVPIVAMTAGVLPEERERCLRSGMNDHMGKPFLYEELIAKIESWIQKPQ